MTAARHAACNWGGEHGGPAGTSKNRMRHPYRIRAAVVLSAALLSACRGSDAVDAAPPQQRQPVAVPVALVTAEQEPVTLEATGSFQPQESSDVAPEASGRVVATPVDVGQFVSAGQVLVRLQGVDADLRLEEARAKRLES